MITHYHYECIVCVQMLCIMSQNDMPAKETNAYHKTLKICSYIFSDYFSPFFVGGGGVIVFTIRIMFGIMN